MKQCNNATSPIVCASIADINAFFTSSFSFSRFISASLVILDTGINPNSQNPYSYTAYQKAQWLLFNQKQQIVGQVFIGTHQINTDTNFLPFQSKTTETGYYVNQAIIATVVDNSSGYYVQCFFIASPIHKVFDRSYGKFDSVLSYVGGLYGIVISFFAFFLLSYNQYKYQLRVSEGAFSFQNGHLAREQNLHFGKYLKYVLFDWIKTFTCHEVDWEDCKAIDQAREEDNEQIDVKHLLKRISHLEKMIGVMVSSQNELVMKISQSYSINQARHQRNIQQYCQKFKDNTRSITISTFETITSIFNPNFLSTLKSSAVYPTDGQAQISMKQMKQRIKQPHGMFQFQHRHKKQSHQSLNIMDEFLEKYQEKFKISEQKFDDLTKQDIQVQKQITMAFYQLKQKDRLKIIKKIPLGILYRIKQCHMNQQKQLSQNTQKLQPSKNNIFAQIYTNNSLDNFDKTVQYKQ